MSSCTHYFYMHSPRKLKTCVCLSLFHSHSLGLHKTLSFLFRLLHFPYSSSFFSLFQSFYKISLFLFPSFLLFSIFLVTLCFVYMRMYEYTTVMLFQVKCMHNTCFSVCYCERAVAIPCTLTRVIIWPCVLQTESFLKKSLYFVQSWNRMVQMRIGTGLMSFLCWLLPSLEAPPSQLSFKRWTKSLWI